MTREDKDAIVRRLKVMYNEAKGNEAKEALFYAIEALQENESLARTVNEAAELLRKIQPRGNCRDRLKETFREASETGGDLFHLSQIERIIDGEDWL